MSTTPTGARTARTRSYADRRVSTETKASFKTSELAVYLLTVVGVLIAAAVVDESDADNVTGFDAHQAWFGAHWCTMLLELASLAHWCTIASCAASDVAEVHQ